MFKTGTTVSEKALAPMLPVEGTKREALNGSILPVLAFMAPVLSFWAPVRPLSEITGGEPHCSQDNTPSIRILALSASVAVIVLRTDGKKVLCPILEKDRQSSDLQVNILSGAASPGSKPACGTKTVSCSITFGLPPGARGMTFKMSLPVASTLMLAGGQDRLLEPLGFCIWKEKIIADSRGSRAVSRNIMSSSPVPFRIVQKPLAPKSPFEPLANRSVIGISKS